MTSNLALIVFIVLEDVSEPLLNCLFVETYVRPEVKSTREVLIKKKIHILYFTCSKRTEGKLLT